MPIYNYSCRDCGADFDLLVFPSETPACPTCGSEKLERLLSRIASELKTPGIAKAGRQAAARAGHLSNFSRKERGGT
jgi:putative FmdB family regulatory protein